MAAPSQQDVDVVVVVRELANGDHVAFPAIEPDLVSYGGSERACLDEQRLFLSEHLRTVPATRLDLYRLASEVTLEEVEVVLPRDDLPRRLRRLPAMTVPCLLVPGAREAWVLALPLHHMFYVEDAAQWRDAAVEEIARIAAARESSPAEYLELLPAWAHRLERLRIRVDREELEAGTQAQRKARALALRKQAAYKLLSEVGDPPPRARGRRRLVGREAELATLKSLLAAGERFAVAVLGREQVGKSALIAAALAGHDRVVMTSGARLIAGQSFFGQWQQRLHDVMKAAELVDAVLWFDNLADLFAARGGDEDFAGVLRPYLERRRVRLVGELLPDVYEEAALCHVGFTSHLHRVRVEPLDTTATRRVLRGRLTADKASTGRGPTLELAALGPLVELVRRYFPYRPLPGAAVRFLDEVLAYHAEQLDGSGEPPTLELRHVYEALSAETGIPVFLLREDRALKLGDVLQAFERRVIGQRPAVERVAQTLCTLKASLQPTGRPLSVFLFVGPTGVGKTEVARALSSFLFGTEERMVRFDMSEYADAWAAERLIRGTEREEGLLTRQIRRQPFSVLLLDEIEKASPAVFDLLLQVMGEARLSDARGKTTYFHNTLIIMTSNLGAAIRRERPGFAGGDETSDAQRYYQEQVEEHFRPEFVNRLDRVVAFEALGTDDVRRIAELALVRLGESHGLAERGVRLDVEAAALEELARRAYDPLYGARQLYRHLQEHLSVPLARLLAARGEDAFGATVEVRLGGKGLSFELRPAPRRGKRTSARELDELAELRREVGRHLRMESLRQLREQIETLTVQLSYGGRKEAQEYDAAYGRLQRELARLSGVWERLAKVREEIEDAEEMALMAIYEGEAAAELVAQARGTARRWWSELPYALLATEKPRDTLILLVSEWDAHRGLELWLAPLLDDASRRGWILTGEPYLGVGAKGRWGSRLAAEELTQWLAGPYKRRRHLLLRVAGPWAWGFLAAEAGLLRFKNVEEHDGETVHLHVERLAWKAELSEEEHELARKLLVRPEKPSVLALQEAVRVYDFRSATLTVPGGAQLVMPWSAYWPGFEEVVAEHLLIYEEDRERERDDELLSTRFED